MPNLYWRVGLFPVLDALFQVILAGWKRFIAGRGMLRTRKTARAWESETETDCSVSPDENQRGLPGRASQAMRSVARSNST